MTISFKVNGKKESVEADSDTPLLWVLRDFLDLTGTKFGCGTVSYTHLTLPTTPYV